jgi:hypothetical protein
MGPTLSWLPPGRQHRFSVEQYSELLLDETIAIWQPYSKRPLSREDARQILENMTGFFQTLLNWDAADRAKSPSGASSPNASDPETTPWD